MQMIMKENKPRGSIPTIVFWILQLTFQGYGLTKF
jgi:hypothetical protein